MTVHPTRDQLRAEAQAGIDHDGPNAWAGIGATDLLALLDQLDAMDARIKAVEDVLDRALEEFDNVDAADIRRALESVTPPGQ